MSRVTQKLVPDASASRLRQMLASEFHQPQPGYVQPLISMTRSGERTHLVVVWDEWKGLSQQERSEIIMRAFADEHGQNSALSVSVAMGLTSAEAERLGFDFEPEPLQQSAA